MSGVSDTTERGSTLAEKIILASLRKQKRIGNNNNKYNWNSELLSALSYQLRV